MPELIAAWDAGVLLFIQEHLRTAAGNAFIPFWSSLGDAGLIWIAAALALLLFKRTRRAGALALGSMALSLLFVNGILKHLVSRPRPWLVVEGLETILYSDDPNSFPSGHTCSAFAFACGLCGGAPARWMKAAALVLATLMGLSRLYVGVHYPSDVLAGAAVGALSGLLACALVRRWEKRRAAG